MKAAQESGKFIKKLRSSTTIPIEHQFTGDISDPNAPAPVSVVSINPNCASHATSEHNELVMKAFKMACLQY